MAAGVVWIAACSPRCYQLPRLFATRLADGTSAVLVCRSRWFSWAGENCRALAVVKACAGLAAPLIGLQYSLPADALWICSFRC